MNQTNQRIVKRTHQLIHELIELNQMFDSGRFNIEQELEIIQLKEQVCELLEV